MGIQFEELPEGITPAPDAQETPTEEPKRRRGRPRSADGATASGKPRLTAADKKNVEAALASMNSVYSLTSMGMLALQRPRTAQFMAGQIDQWQAGNRQAFEASPALAARVASAGQVSGSIIFAATNLMAAGTVFMAMREEGALIAAQREAANPAQSDTPGEWNG